MYRLLYCVSLAPINTETPRTLSTSVWDTELQCLCYYTVIYALVFFYWNVNSWRAGKASNQYLVWGTYSINGCWKKSFNMLWLPFFHCLPRCSFSQVSQPCLLALPAIPYPRSGRPNSFSLGMQGLLDLGLNRPLQAKPLSWYPPPESLHLSFWSDFSLGHCSLAPSPKSSFQLILNIRPIFIARPLAS